MKTDINFKMGMNCFDHASKDNVTITNGIEKEGRFIPTEALALRVIGFNKRRPVIAYTYIGVKSENLTAAKDQTHFDCIKTLFPVSDIV